MLLAAIADDPEALQAIAEVVKAVEAQKQAPELYLVLLFAAVVAVVSIVFVYKSHGQIGTVVQKNSDKEDVRMQTMRSMQDASLEQHRENITTTATIAGRCEHTLARTATVLEKIEPKLNGEP